MLPRPSGDNPPDGLFAYVETYGDLGLRKPRSNKNPNPSNIFFRELVATIVFTLTYFRIFTRSVFVSASRSMESFIPEIVHIIRVSAWKKVRRANARFVIAIVAYFKAVWNFTYKKVVRKPVCPILAGVNPHHSIAVAFGSSPNPAPSEAWFMFWYRPVLIDLFIETNKNSSSYIRKFYRFHA